MSITLLLPLALAVGPPVGQRSRCIASSFQDICTILPVGVPERFGTSEDKIRLFLWSLCDDATATPPLQYNVYATDISRIARAPPAEPFFVGDSELVMASGEPGTQLFNVTLHDPVTAACVDWMLLCVEIVPGAWASVFNAASDPVQPLEPGVLVVGEVSAVVERAAATPPHTLTSRDEYHNGYPAKAVLPISVLWVRGLYVCYWRLTAFPVSPPLRVPPPPH